MCIEKKTHPLTLLECLIALVLIALIAIPLLHTPAFFFRKQYERLDALEEARIADLLFEQAKQQMPEWSAMRKTTTLTFEAPVHMLKHPYVCSGTMEVIRPKEPIDGETARLLEINIFVNKKKFLYNLLVEKNETR